jgi:hypothetical protein
MGVKMVLSELELGELLEILEEIGVELTDEQYEKLKEMVEV